MRSPRAALDQREALQGPNALDATGAGARTTPLPRACAAMSPPICRRSAWRRGAVVLVRVGDRRAMKNQNGPGKRVPEPPGRDEFHGKVYPTECAAVLERSVTISVPHRREQGQHADPLREPAGTLASRPSRNCPRRGMPRRSHGAFPFVADQGATHGAGYGRDILPRRCRPGAQPPPTIHRPLRRHPSSATAAHDALADHAANPAYELTAARIRAARRNADSVVGSLPQAARKAAATAAAL